MTYSVHPVILAAGLGILLALVALIVACTARTTASRWKAVAVAVVLLLPTAAVVVAVNPRWYDGRFRTFGAFYRDIREGMTRGEIVTLIDRHYPKSGSRLPPIVMEDTPPALGLFMNSEGSREPNCEGIFLVLDEGGRVKEKRYSPD